MSIALTDNERALFALLLHVNEAAALGLVLRVAGGWVRDKLMGLESSDIDIAIDKMLGFEFAQHVNSYLQEHGKEVHTVCHIEANPAQSKNLDTARVKVMGADIDFVNLRSETYAADSRIPTIEFGTPKEDAERRDLTINALFYNINEAKVEDFTERGFHDIKNEVIRTPLEPLATLLDDPLRAVRILRFASRFSKFTVVPELLTALGSECVHDGLVRKVSVERVGKELDLIAEKSDIGRFAELLRETNLLQPMVLSHLKVLWDASEFRTRKKWQPARLAEYPRLAIDALFSIAKHPLLGTIAPAQRHYLILFALLQPFLAETEIMPQYTPQRRTDKERERCDEKRIFGFAVERVDKYLMVKMKRPVRDCNIVSRLQECVCAIRFLVLGGLKDSMPYIDISLSPMKTILELAGSTLDHVAAAMILRYFSEPFGKAAAVDVANMLYISLETNGDQAVSEAFKRMLDKFPSLDEVVLAKPSGFNVVAVATKLGVTDRTRYQAVKNTFVRSMFRDPENVARNSEYKDAAFTEIFGGFE